MATICNKVYVGKNIFAGTSDQYTAVPVEHTIPSYFLISLFPFLNEFSSLLSDPPKEHTGVIRHLMNQKNRHWSNMTWLGGRYLGNHWKAILPVCTIWLPHVPCETWEKYYLSLGPMACVFFALINFHLVFSYLFYRSRRGLASKKLFLLSKHWL